MPAGSVEEGRRSLGSRRLGCPSWPQIHQLIKRCEAEEGQAGAGRNGCRDQASAGMRRMTDREFGTSVVRPLNRRKH
jgi:hypothetical protein